MRKPALVGLAVSAVLGAFTVAARVVWIAIPPEYVPWTPLDVTATPNIWTRHKLARLNSNAEWCRDSLARSALEFEPVPDRVTGEGCGFTDAVLVRRTTAEVSEVFSITCRTAVSLAMWEQHVVQPAAQRHFGQDVRVIEHFGSYSCRNVYGRPAATRSRHATAEAWDVAGFVLADGKRVRIVRDWQGAGADAGFLRDVRDGACQFFDAVLSPDYNQAHRDHLHLDRGPYRMCR